MLSHGPNKMLSYGQFTGLVFQLLCLTLRYAESAVLDDLAPCPNGCDRGRYCDTFMRFCESCLYCDSTSPCWSSCSDWLATTQPPTNAAPSLSTDAKTTLPSSDARATFPPIDAPPKETPPLTTTNTTVADLHVALLFGLLLAWFVFSIIGYLYCFHRKALRKFLSRSSNSRRAEGIELEELSSNRQQPITVPCSSAERPRYVVIDENGSSRLLPEDGPISAPRELDPNLPFDTQQDGEMTIRENPLNMLNAIQDDGRLDTEMLQQARPIACPALSQTVADGTHDNHEVTTGASSFSASLSDEAGASRDAS